MEKKGNIYGDHSDHKWITKSICRHLLYESCDLKGSLGLCGKEYRKHLFSRSNNNFSDDKFREKATNIMMEFYDYMSDEMILFPMFGTLLGIVRDEELIKHDDDIDFGYFKKDEKILVDKLDKIHNKDGFKLIRNEYSNLYSLHKDGVLIDLYEYEVIENENLLQQGHRTGYNLKYDEVFPMTEIKFKDKSLSCISEPIKFFERYYGQDWNVPK
jgi:hypothetical protein